MERRKNNVLISFVGTNDNIKFANNKCGPVLTVLKHLKFDKVFLLWTSSNKNNFDEISRNLVNEIKKKKLSKSVERHYIDIVNVIDHNEIYPKLLNFLINKFRPNNDIVTAAIASGTPSMQACWILIAESNDFNLKLIRSNEKETGLKPVTTVKLGTGLPRIVKLEESIKKLQKINRELLPKIEMNISSPHIKIGDVEIYLSPILFCYYRYFLERAMNREKPLRAKVFEMDKEFIEKIVSYYEESFSEYDIHLAKYKKMLKTDINLSVSSFGSNRTKLNNKLKQYIQDESILNFITISSQGKRGSVYYEVSFPPEKITITK